MQLLRVMGNEPNLKTDIDGEKLAAGQEYSFDLERMAFFHKDGGGFTSDHIKLLRLSLGDSPATLHNVQVINDLLGPSLGLVTTIRQQVLRV
jgi:hypothetical protein